MNPSLLRALEFDRIVDALASFALTPVGKARMRAEAPETDRATVAQALAATSETVRYVEQNGVFPLRAGAGLEQALAGTRGRGPSARGAATAHPRGFRGLDRRRTGSGGPRARRVPDPAGAGGPPRPVHRRSGGRAPRHRRERRGARRRQPAPRVHPRTPAPAAHEAAHHARAVREGPRHREIPAGHGRHAAQRPRRADGARRTSRQRAGHRARGVGHRRHALPRADGRRRDQQRHRGGRGRGSRGDLPHPPRAHRALPPSSRRLPGECRGGRGTRPAAGAGPARPPHERGRAGAVDQRASRTA